MSDSTPHGATDTHPVGHDSDHPFPVTVRTLAGHSDHVQVRPEEFLSTVIATEVAHFISKGQLTAGDYALTLPRGGDGELDPSATVEEAGLVKGDVLVLVNRKPHQDG